MRYEYCATIGFFDGVHRGHQFMIDRLAGIAHAKARQSLVITFDRHPRQVVHADYVPELITTLDEKLRLLGSTRADRIEVLHFDTAMAQLSARSFIHDVLSATYGVDTLLIGYDNRFGHNRTEGFDDYVRYGVEVGMEVLLNTPVDIDGMRVSSSLIRRLLAEGDITEANRCLGHPYSIEGCVAHGFQEGRRIGFPTANIEVESTDKLIPKQGVYAARASVEGGPWMPAMLNIGTNPTFARRQLTIEAHLIGFDGDIYGRHICLELISRLRDETTFDSVDALRSQLEADRRLALRVCSEHADTAGDRTITSVTD